MRAVRPLAGALLGAAALVAAAGCASYTHKALAVRAPLARGDLEAAEAFLVEEKPGGDGLPYLMELGLVQRYRRELDRSNVTFDEAERLVQELWTKSVSKELLAFATSDETIPYDGEMWERVLINYYRALNYIELGDFDGALVEARKINQKLRVYTGELDDPPAYDRDAFAQYVTALLYEAGGDISDAWVSLRLADEGYADWSEVYGVGHPDLLKKDLYRLARQQGFGAEAEAYRERFGDAAEGPPTGELMSRGEVVLFWEEGFVPAKVQREITLPIFKREEKTDVVTLAPTLVNRYYVPVTYSNVELAYLLRVALPDYPPPTPAEAPGSAVLEVVAAPEEADGAGTNGDRGEDGEPSPGLSAETELASNLNLIARQGLVDRYPNILLRTIARGLAKYGMTRAAEDQNEALGFFANLFGAVTEKADTRSWITLPNTIQVARLRLPPGEHDLRLRCYDAGGKLTETVTFEGVRVGAGEIRFLAHRTF